MEKKAPFRRFLSRFDPSGTKKYITQITLILFSLLIATSVDRCREAEKDHKKLREYLLAIQEDLKSEIETCEMNRKDCKRDVECLGETLHYINMPQHDSLALAMSNFVEVYWRGVFRGFPPTTFEIMSESGDANLLKSMVLRNNLASVFAFRKNVIKPDLEKYDQQTAICAEQLGRHVDLTKLLYSESFDEACFTDKAGFLKSPHNEVLLLLRAASLRGFHLENALEGLRETEKDLSEYLKTL